MTNKSDTSGLGASLDDNLARLDSLKSAADGFSGALSSGLKAAVIQGKALDDVLKQMLLRLSGKALEAALTPLTDLLGTLAKGLAGAIGNGLKGLAGGAVPFAKGGVVPFAGGGVVATPTYFPMPDGRTGLFGEAGAEAILPLARGADGQLGVKSGGGGVSVTFNVTTPGVEGFRQSEAQITAMLARAVGRGRRGL
ncbi:phage tail tape measure protein [Oryzibacter oryziterrae]|uniref:phage tail tape measure protein n=1 Tax=Oryzibacter oryziterrae TaxID=2766474 RepID=UPI001F390F39|nr:phage tail tape measure protein [Oryzibacter oryziterrae]